VVLGILKFEMFETFKSLMWNLCDMHKGMILDKSKLKLFFQILKAGLDYSGEVQEFQSKTRLFEAMVGMAVKLDFYLFLLKRLKLEFYKCQVVCLRI
jgi:hypothetical protein